MPQPWDQKRIAALVGMVRDLIKACDLDDDDADRLVAILLPKLWRRSGLDVFTFREKVKAMLASSDSLRDRIPDWAAHSSRH